MPDYQAIAELVNQLPADTWDVLCEIRQRRPAMMLSELIECHLRALQRGERLELRSPVNGSDNDRHH